MSDQAETLRRIMRFRERNPEPAVERAISVFLAPSVRRARLFSPRELALVARAREAGFRVRDESDPLVANGGDPEILGRLLVVSEEARDLVACRERIELLARDRTVNKMDVLVCVDAAEAAADGVGRRIFTRLFGEVPRVGAIDLVYLGAFGRREKIRECLAISNYLLHYRRGSRDLNDRQDAGMASS